MAEVQQDDMIERPCSPEGERGLAELRRFFAARMAGRHALSMPERRASFAGLMTTLFPQDPGASPVVATCAGVPVETHEPPAGAIATVLYLHGGAYVSGGPATHRYFCAGLARLSGARIVAPDYRLAPEHPYPAAIDDCFSVFAELRSSPDGLPLLVGGDSAGGGLTLALAQRLRDAGGPLPAALLLLSPFTDLTLSLDSHRRLAQHDPFLTTSGLAADVARYIPAFERRREPLASPLFGDLRGVPETFLQVGADEILLDDSVMLLRKLRRCGVPVTAEFWNGMVHNWHLFPNWLPEADAATGTLADFIRSIAARH